MFRLIKLSAYLLLGYTLYELILGVLEGSGGVHPQASTEPPAPRSPRRRVPSPQPATLTGSATAEVGGNDGSHRRTRVGRGVVSR